MVMNREADVIVDILEQLVITCRNLHEASQRKCEGLASMNLAVIQQTGDEEEALSRKLRELNATRRSVLRQITGEEESTSKADICKEGPMQRFTAMLPESDRAKVNDLLKELGDEMKRTQLLNITNKIVSKRSLRHFRGMLNIILNGSACDGSYNRQGMPSRDFRRSGLVNHIA